MNAVFKSVTRTALALLVAAAASAPALAHDDATLDQMPSAHGGQIRMAGMYHLELVLAKDAKGGETAAPVKVYFTDHMGKSTNVIGASGSLTLLSPAGKVVVPLSADGDHLQGSAPYVAHPATKAVVQVKFADGKGETARFEPFKKK